jgi:hypothetical protein
VELIEFPAAFRDESKGNQRQRGRAMLAEKFFLILESLIRTQTYSDGSPRVISTSPHVPVKLPGSGK